MTRASIAIVGMAARFPGARNLDEFWQLLRNGGDAIREVPDDRWQDMPQYASRLTPVQRGAARWGGFLDHPDEFDAAFFGISATEACSLDPKQRLALELAWEALEDASVAPDSLKGSMTGVYLGTSVYDYYEQLASVPDRVNAYFSTGNNNCLVANRIAYLLDLRGPNFTVETACSASLTATHLACMALADGSATMALAGGIMHLLSASLTASFAMAGFLAPDGRCKAFDDRANGYVRSEGAGIVVLKTLERATADGDRIYAVIRGSAINQDGRSNGLTAPNPHAQTALLRRTCALTGIAPRDVQYVETHGTGTRLGDPIEAKALAAAYCEERTAEQALRIGSVKTNIGHTEAAAGIAGIIKVALALHHREIPPSIHFETPNALIPFGDLRLRVQTVLESWASSDGPRLAAVSSFGFGGSNAHAILAEAPEARVARADDRPAELICLSAKTQDALDQLRQRFGAACRAADTVELADSAYTLHVGRAHFRHRVAIVATSIQGALRDIESRDKSGSIARTTTPRIAFLFSGQGAQFAGMGRALYENLRPFRDHFDAAADVLAEQTGVSPHELCWGAQSHTLSRTRHTQPAVFLVEYAMARTLLDFGITPVGVLGHSLGEYAAAVVAGVMTLQDAAKLVCIRAAVIDEVPEGGGMLAVLASAAVAAEFVRGAFDNIVIAGINGPEATTLSGPAMDLHNLQVALNAAGISSQLLNVSHAFHSPAMDGATESFLARAGDPALAAPRIPFFSTSTGSRANSEVAGVRYWADQIRRPVRFADAFSQLASSGVDALVEVGPGSTLIGLARRMTADNRMLMLPSMVAGEQSWEQFLESLGRLYECGARLDWTPLYQGGARRKISLPTYPFQRQRYWFEDARSVKTSSTAAAPTPASMPDAQELEQHRRALLALERGARAKLPDIVANLAAANASIAGVSRARARLHARLTALLAQHAESSPPSAGDAPQNVESPAAESRLLQRCIDAAPQVFRGEISAVQLLFGGEGAALLQEIYGTTPGTRACNLLLARALREASGETGTPLRILEVGAGTGGTTRVILGELAGRPVEYTFSDVSSAFVAAARTQFGAHPDLRFRVLDLERAPEAQGLRPQTFDAIVGANVVHATRDVRASLRRLAPLLRPGGQLLLLEVIRPQAWLDLTFGLTDGWWSYEDDRRDSPILTVPEWNDRLHDCGFTGLQWVGLELDFHHAVVCAGVDALAVPLATQPARAGVHGGASHEIRMDPGALIAPAVDALTALPPQECRAAISKYLRGQLIDILGFEERQVDVEQGFTDLGLDSLGAVEMRNRIERAWRLNLPTATLFDYPTLNRLAAHLADRLLATRNGSRPAPTIVPEPMEHSPELLADDEVVRRLQMKVGQYLDAGGIAPP